MVDEGEGVVRKKPKLYTPEGEEVQEDLRPPWCSVARTALQASGSGKTESLADPKTTNKEEHEKQVKVDQAQRDRGTRIRSMFEHIAAAKSELEVMIDTLSELQRGSLLTIGGIEKSETKLRQQAPILATERKSKQLSSIASMFRDAHASLSSKVLTSKTFYTDLRRLHRNWKIKHSAKNPQTGFCFDLSFGQLDFESNKIEICRESNGKLYIVVNNSDPESESAGQSELRAAGAVEVDRLLRKVQGDMLRRIFNQALHRKVSHTLIVDHLYTSELGGFLPFCLSNNTTGHAAGVLERALYIRMVRAFLDMFERNENKFLPLLEIVSGILKHEQEKERVLERLQSDLPRQKYLQCYLDESCATRSGLKIQKNGSSNHLCVYIRGDSIQVERESFPSQSLDKFCEGRFDCSYSKLKQFAWCLSELQ